MEKYYHNIQKIQNNSTDGTIFKIVNKIQLRRYYLFSIFFTRQDHHTIYLQLEMETSNRKMFLLNFCVFIPFSLNKVKKRKK